MNVPQHMDILEEKRAQMALFRGKKPIEVQFLKSKLEKGQNIT